MKFKIERAKTGRAKCKGRCQNLIEKDAIKLVYKVMNSFTGHLSDESYCGVCGVEKLEREKEKLDKLKEKVDQSINELKSRSVTKPMVVMTIPSHMDSNCVQNQ